MSPLLASHRVPFAITIHNNVLHTLVPDCTSTSSPSSSSSSSSSLWALSSSSSRASNACTSSSNRYSHRECCFCCYNSGCCQNFFLLFTRTCCTTKGNESTEKRHKIRRKNRIFQTSRDLRKFRNQTQRNKEIKKNLHCGLHCIRAQETREKKRQVW